MYHATVGTILREAPPVVWPPRPVADAEYPPLTVRSSQPVPPPDAPEVRSVMLAARKFVEAWERAGRRAE